MLTMPEEQWGQGQAAEGQHAPSTFQELAEPRVHRLPELTFKGDRALWD